MEDDTSAFGFPRALEYARRAAAVYEPDDAIRQSFGQGTHLEIRDLPGIDVRAFVEIDRQRQVQWVVVRGTANLANVKVDAEWHEDAEARLGIPIHRGFFAAAIAVHDFARPLLDPAFETRVTGHSLGGAGAAVLLMLFQQDGLRLGRAMTFGQPKVTNQSGVTRFRDLPLLRFVNHDDPVPLLPPRAPGEGPGGYRHFGPEVWLLDAGGFRFFPEHWAEAPDVTAFWSHLGKEAVSEHFIARYLANLERQAQLFPQRTVLEPRSASPSPSALALPSVP
jgi:triacylglycerol lipase